MRRVFDLSRRLRHAGWRVAARGCEAGWGSRLAATGGALATLAASAALSTAACDSKHYFQPLAPYPEWDPNWDFRGPPLGQQRSQPSGPVRHVILVRHAQYDERERDDAMRVLTPLGRQQAEITAERLAEIARATRGRVRIHSSTMTRARQTAEIIRERLGPGTLSGSCRLRLALYH